MNGADWSKIFKHGNLDNKINRFYNILLESLDTKAPEKNIIIRHTNKKWFDEEVRETIKRIDLHYNGFQNTKPIEDS